MKNEYGIQLYSVRDLAQTDLRRALIEVGKIGYRYVEFAGFFGHTAEEVRAYMEEAGVKCSGTHSPVDDLAPDRIDATIAYLKTIGCDDFIVPWTKLTTLTQIQKFTDVVKIAEPKLRDAGIRLGYHNHSVEFQIMYWGSTQHTELEKRTDLHFEIDTYWAYNAGVDPVALCERLKDRIHVIHLKDGLPGGRGVALGEGQAPVAQVIAMAERNGFRMVVESEGLNPTGLEEVARCMNYLNKMDP